MGCVVCVCMCVYECVCVQQLAVAGCLCVPNCRSEQLVLSVSVYVQRAEPVLFALLCVKQIV